MHRFFGRLIIKLVSWIISLLFGFLHLILSVVLELTSLVIGPGIALLLILAIVGLVCKEYTSAGSLAACMGIGYLIIAAIAFIMFLAELVRDYFKDLSRIKLFR